MKSKKEVVDEIMILLEKRQHMRSITRALVKATLKKEKYPDLLNIYKNMEENNGTRSTDPNATRTCVGGKE